MKIVGYLFKRNHRQFAENELTEEFLICKIYAEMSLFDYHKMVSE